MAQVPGAIQPITPYQPPDALGMVSQYAGLQNQLIANSQNQQTLNARQAIGQAYSQAVDPTTGQLDTNKLMSAVAGNPQAAYLAGDVASQAQARAIQQQQLSGMQLDQALKRSQYVGNGLQALWQKANSSQGVSGQDVIGQLGSAVAEGVMTAPQASQYISDMPPGGPPLMQWLKNHMVNNGNTQQALQAMYGSAQTINTGPAQTVQTVNPVTGQVTPLAGGTFVNGMTPGDANSPTQLGTNPQTGQPIMGTKQQFANAAQPPGPMGSGRYPTPGTAAQPGGGIPMGLPVGQEQAMNVEAHSSAQSYVQAAQNAENVPTNKALLQNMAGDLQGFTSGPGNVEWRQTIAGLNRAFGTNIDASGVASAENFAKLGNQIAIAQAGQMGGGTNDKLAAAMQANPNPHLSVPGNQQIIHILTGNQDAIGAWNQAAQEYQSQHGPQSYQSFVSATSK
jgi:hypothetical protein